MIAEGHASRAGSGSRADGSPWSCPRPEISPEPGLGSREGSQLPLGVTETIAKDLPVLLA